jgi:salicylate hydroxylase
MSLRVLIAGGGIGGLSAAVGLSRLGLEPVVLEQAAELREVGAGLWFPPIAGKVAEHLGLGDHVRRLAVYPRQWTHMSLESGEVLQRMDLTWYEDRFGTPCGAIHRADLFEGLLAALPEGRVRVGSRVVAFEETREDVRVELAGGEVVRGDVLVGADGLNSVVREQLFGAQEAVFTGLVAWRGTVENTEALRVSAFPEVRFAKGERGALLTYPVRAGELLNFVAVVTAADERRSSWSLRGDPGDLRLAFADACEEVRGVLAAVEETFVTAFYDRPPLPSWGTARVTVLGDAAHPTSPSTGSGAAMALEDAITVAHCLARCGGDVGTGLAEYAARRRPRTTKFLLQARHNNAEQFEAQRDPLYRAAFAGKFEGILQLDPDGDSINWTRQGWLWKFDPVGALELPPEATYPPGWEVANGLVREEARRAFELWAGVLSFDDMPTWRNQRTAYEQFLNRNVAAPAGLVVEELDCDGVPCLRVTPPGSAGGQGPLLLHLHGGGFVLGCARSAVGLAGRLAEAVGGTALVVDYRLSPEHAYPAALEDALTAYRFLLADQGGDPRRITVSGEDAGGGLAISLACSLRDAGEPLPAAIYTVSPFCDLTLTTPSIDTAADPWLNRDLLTHFAASYIQATDPTDPLVTPLHADLGGLPPLLIQAAEGEALADQARQLAAKARQDGVEVDLTLVPDTVHSFVLFDFLPETTTALEQLETHVRDHAAVEAE